MLYVNDSSRVWHVAKSGNDANSGHAGQYPVNLANDAKLTIGAAVTAAASGDTIIIWPGTYAEQIDLSSKPGIILQGFGAASNIEVAADAVPIVILGDDCQLLNLKVKNSGAIVSGTRGVIAIGKANIKILDCTIEAADMGVMLAAQGTVSASAQISRCFITGGEFGVSLAGNYTSIPFPTLPSRFLLKDCVVAIANWNICHASGIMVSERCSVCVDNCVVVAKNNIVDYTVAGVTVYCITAGFIPRMTLSNCVIYALGKTGSTSKGVETMGNGGNIVLNGCIVHALNYSLYNAAANGVIVVANSAYDINKTYGTVVQSDSGWSNALCAALFTNGAANKLKIDAAGAVDASNLGDIDLTLLHKAAKMLLNKAVQDKLTGEIQYFDDDGQTVIVTHTPDEDESSFTRTTS